jgi:hypothetical protein
LDPWFRPIRGHALRPTRNSAAQDHGARSPRWRCTTCREIRIVNTFGGISTFSMNSGGKTPGVDVMIIIFCDFCYFSAKKLAFFSKTNVMIKILHNLALFGVKNGNFFAIFFGKNILKIITSSPDPTTPTYYKIGMYMSNGLPRTILSFQFAALNGAYIQNLLYVSMYVCMINCTYVRRVQSKKIFFSHRTTDVNIVY